MTTTLSRGVTIHKTPAGYIIRKNGIPIGKASTFGEALKQAPN